MGSPPTTAARPVRRPPLPLQLFLIPVLVALWLAGIGYCLWRGKQGVLDWLLDGPVLFCLAVFPVLILFELTGMVRMFGPVLYYDLIRQSRRLRFLIVRFLYASGLFSIVCWVYWSWHSGPYNEIRPSDLPKFAQSFFYAFLVVQTILVLVLTPAYTAGAITDEKERKTLQFLLATDLYDREIIFSKLLSRILNILLAVLVGLPILSILQLIGGIDPNVLLASFAATASVVVSLAALSIFNSTMLKRSRDAIMLTYLTPPIYVLVSVLGRYILPVLLALYNSDLMYWPGTIDEPPFFSLMDAINVLGSGDPVYVIEAFDQMQTPGSSLTLWDLTRNFVLFHGYVAIFCTGASLLLLRRQALKEASETIKKGWGLPRPRIGDFAMIWKEVWAERGVQLHLLARAGLIALVFLSFIPTYFILDDYFSTGSAFGRGVSSKAEVLRTSMNINVRIVGSGIACLLLAGVAVRAASSVSGERDKQTLDTLLTTPLEASDIIFGKVVGAIASMRWLWLWLLAHWFLAVVTGGLSPLAVPMLFGMWLVYAAFCALVGVWYSVTVKTTLGATVATLSTLTGLALGHWLIWMCCFPLFITNSNPPEDLIEVVGKFQMGLTPPIALGWMAFYHDSTDNELQIEMIAYTLAATLVWAFGAIGVWGLVTERFARMTRRSSAHGSAYDLPPLKRRRPRPRRRPDPDEDEPGPDKRRSIYRPDERLRPEEDDDP